MGLNLKMFLVRAEEHVCRNAKLKHFYFCTILCKMYVNVVLTKQLTTEQKIKERLNGPKCF